MTNISDLQIESRLRLDLEDTACRIEYEFADELLAAPKGIYVINKVAPVMVDGVEYYTISNNKGIIKRTPVHDISNLKECIYTEAKGDDKISRGFDRIIIPKVFMMNKDKFISNTPTKPYRGIKIMEGLVNHQIDSFLKYRKSNKSDVFVIKNNLIKLKKERCNRIIDKMINIYEDITAPTIRQFMGMHDWHLYFIKMSECIMQIEKSIDYRAYEYIKLMENKECID